MIGPYRCHCFPSSPSFSAFSPCSFGLEVSHHLEGWKVWISTKFKVPTPPQSAYLVLNAVRSFFFLGKVPKCDRFSDFRGDFSVLVWLVDGRVFDLLSYPQWELCVSNAHKFSYIQTLFHFVIHKKWQCAMELLLVEKRKIRSEKGWKEGKDYPHLLWVTLGGSCV